MRRLFAVLILTVAVSALTVLPSGAAAPPAVEDRTKTGDRFTLTAPKSLADLHRLEARVQYVIGKAMPATVGIGGGSAVVVSKEGLMLTVAHVGNKAGRDLLVQFPDGKRARGKTLGNYHGVDAGMARITDKGRWPYAEMGKSSRVKPGDWCVTMGYPISFSKGMKPPVRVGRVLQVTGTAIVTDCPMMGGDSGGPIFDMDGRVIGQNSRTAGGITGNVHVPVNVYLTHWPRFLRGEDWTAPRGGTRRSGLDEDEEDTAAPPMLKPRLLPGAPRRAARTGPNERVHDAVKQAFREATQPAVKSVVRVVCDGRPLALGTIVSPDGLVVTKATALKGLLGCKLHDGRVVAAIKLGEDRENDLAVLQVDATGLTPARWRTGDVVAQGNLVAAVGEKGEPLSVGTVTSEPRQFRITERPGTPARTQPYLGVYGEDVPGKGVRLREVIPNQAAAKAGLKTGDFIRRVGDREVKTLTDLRATIGKFKAGERVSLLVQRGTAQEEIAPLLGKQEIAAAAPPYDRWGGGPFSEQRRFGYGKVLPHDTYLHPHDMGGPIVDTKGQVVGVNVSRALRISTYALLPADIERLVAKITAKSGM